MLDLYNTLVEGDIKVRYCYCHVTGKSIAIAQRDCNIYVSIN